jgi:uncharacterized protein (DUF1800 family)
MARTASRSRPRYLTWVLAPLAAMLIGLSLVADPGAPAVQVFDGPITDGTIIPLNGTDAYSLPTKAGTDSSKTFTVKNNGNADLLVGEAISVPQGFTLMQNFPGVPNATLNGAPAYTIPAGTTATFKVALNSATAGDFSGPVSFATNDTNNNPFIFNVTGTVLEPPSVRIVDDGDSGFSASAGWSQPSPNAAAFNQELRTVAAGTGIETATWTFNNLEPGDYHVAATWPVGGATAATNATYVVCDPNISDPNQQVLGTVQVNQQAASAGFTDAGSTWQDLGVFTIGGSATAGPTLVVKLTDNANGMVIADAVRIERVGYPGAIVDDTSAQFSTPVGTWTRVADNTSAGDFQKGRTTAAGTDGATATASAQWTFTVAPGTYRVVASYAGLTGYATNAAYRVFDNTTSLTPSPILLDQTAAPTDTLGFGPGWKHLGFFTVASNTLVVQLSNEGTGAGKTVDADAVAIELVNTPTIVSAADAFRFLEQASWGPAPGDVANLQNLGLNGWLSQQFTLTPSTYGPLPLYNTNNNVTNNNTTSCYGDPTVAGNPARTACLRDHYSMYPLQNTLFWNALYQLDQLNQRVAWALHKIWVISGVEVTQSAWMANYLDTLGADALGNYRTVMYDVTLNAGMGNYLNMAGSTKAAPNENYPRELMQLFTIGLYELNPDGTQKLDSSSQPIPTYDQNLVNNMTRVFTGWNRAPQVASGIPNYMEPMRLNGAATENPTNHDFNSPRPTLLRGFVLPARTSSVANAYLDLNDGLDNIYYHPSCAPFICKQLIQQLVTSNPTPGYVARVVDTWNRNNTAANQMQLVMTAILLDPEARGDRKNAVNYGHLREPALYILNLMRMFGALSDDLTQQSDGYLNPLAVNMGQDVFRPPSVFSYFSPGKVAVGGNPPVVGPEFQIQNTSTALARANFINTAVTPNSSRAIDVVRAHGTTPNGTDPNGNPIVPTGPLGTAIDVTGLFQTAGDAGALADTLNGTMLHGSMSPEIRNAIVTAVNKVAVTNPRKRVHTAIYLIASSSQYQVQR